jgi:MFS superfamily sulfate permease-like transporter
MEAAAKFTTWFILGCVIGVMMDNLAAGIGIGLALAIAMQAHSSYRNRQNNR